MTEMKTREELLNDLAKLSDGMKAEYLEREMKKLPVELKKVALIILAELYAKRKWYGSAASCYEKAVELTTKFREKRVLYMKIVEKHIESDNYVFAEDAFRKAFEIANSKEKEEIVSKVKALYLKHAQDFLLSNKFNKAADAFKKLLGVEPKILSDNERKTIAEKTALIYEKLGKPQEAAKLKALR